MFTAGYDVARANDYTLNRNTGRATPQQRLLEATDKLTVGTPQHVAPESVVHHAERGRGKIWVALDGASSVIQSAFTVA